MSVLPVWSRCGSEGREALQQNAKWSGFGASREVSWTLRLYTYSCCGDNWKMQLPAESYLQPQRRSSRVSLKESRHDTNDDGLFLALSVVLFSSGFVGRGQRCGRRIVRLLVSSSDVETPSIITLFSFNLSCHDSKSACSSVHSGCNDS